MRHFTFSFILFICLTNSLHAQWESLGSGTTTTPRVYFALDVVDAQTVWGVTINPVSRVATNEVVKSTDGGETWEVLTLPALSEIYYTLDVQALDETTAWILLVDLPRQVKTKIFKTIDGGLSWTEQTGEFNEDGRAATIMHFFNENEGLCFGSPGSGDAQVDSIHVYSTIDGGISWDRIPASELPAPLAGEGNWLYSGNGSYEVKGDTIWFVTRRSRVFRSVDKGSSWEAFETGIHAGLGLSSIAFEDDLNGIVIGAEPNRAARTTDGGETWTEIAIPASPVASLIEYIPGTDDSYVIAPGFFRGGTDMAVTRNGGREWTSTDVGSTLMCLQFISPIIGFAGGTVNTRLSEGLFEWTGDLSDPLYVNQAATGANNGTSWEDAFTDLQSALAVADSTSQVWVAQGTYKPTSSSMHPDSTLFLDTVGVKLYGGFAGVEILVDQRGAEANPTILSGDLLGNDVAGNFAENRDDNTRHLLFVNHANRSLVDGFTISGGNALVGEVFQDTDYLGGGLFAFADIDVNDCIFVDNQAGQGAGMVWNAGNFSVTNCSFIQNNSTFSALLAANGTAGDTSLISGNRFENNSASSDGGGAGIYFCDVIINDNFFEGNSSGNFGGGMYVAGGSATITENVFESNVGELGGGLIVGNSEAIIQNNVFEENTGDLGGGAFIFQNDFAPGGKTVSLANNRFLNNSTSVTGGALTINNFNEGSVYNIGSCHFEGNTTDLRGGAVSLNNFNGAMGTVFYTSSFFLEDNTFVNNTASNGGGLSLYNEADEMTASIISSTFEENVATNEGGGIYVAKGGNSEIGLQMKNLVISKNTATENGGGLYLDVGLPGELLNSTISENSAAEGAAIYLESSTDMSVENTLIAENTGNSTIYNDQKLKLVGVTCAANGTGLIQGDFGSVVFQNTIMANDENYSGTNDNYSSLGGNLSSDGTLTEAFTGAGEFPDLNETDPELDADFIPTFSSPCVDGGNPSLITVTEDLAGNDRVQGTQIDIGAYETSFITAVQALANVRSVEVFPNPFLHEIQTTSEYQILALELFDVKGSLVAKQLNGSALRGLELLPAGTYLLKIETAKGVESLKVIKR